MFVCVLEKTYGPRRPAGAAPGARPARPPRPAARSEPADTVMNETRMHARHGYRICRTPTACRRAGSRPAHRTALAGGGPPRSAGGWRIRLRGPHHRRVLPPVVSVTRSETGEHGVLRYLFVCGGGGLPALPALPAGRTFAAAAAPCAGAPGLRGHRARSGHAAARAAGAAGRDEPV